MRDWETVQVHIEVAHVSNFDAAEQSLTRQCLPESHWLVQAHRVESSRRKNVGSGAKVSMAMSVFSHLAARMKSSVFSVQVVFRGAKQDGSSNGPRTAVLSHKRTQDSEPVAKDYAPG
jgi:hypothetical protein